MIGVPNWRAQHASFNDICFWAASNVRFSISFLIRSDILLYTLSTLINGEHMPFDYILNDPSTPNLHISIDQPATSAITLPYTVFGYNGLVNGPGDVERHAAQVLVSMSYVF